METVPAASAERRNESLLRWGTSLMIFGALVIIALGVIYFVNNFTRFFEFGIGHHQVSITEAEVEAFSPSLRDYVSHLHIAAAGLLASSGLFVIVLTWFGVRRRQLWAWVSAVAISTFAVATILPANYIYGFSTLRHLGIPYVSIGTFFAGALLALMALIRAPDAP